MIYQEFIELARAYGLIIETAYANTARCVRVPLVDSKHGVKDGEYRLMHDNLGIGGYIKNYKTGAYVSFFRKDNSISEIKAIKIAEKRKIDAKKDLSKEHNKQAKLAKYLCTREFKKAVSHPYLTLKIVKPHNTLTDNDGNLIIPLRNIKGSIRSFVKVTPDNLKTYLKNAQKHGCFYQFGFIKSKVIICEGFATGASIYESTNIPTISAMDAGNLEPVAIEIRKKYGTKIVITIAGDDDHKSLHNIGKISAEKAAKAVGGRYILPEFTEKQLELGMTDFNDWKNNGVNISRVFFK